MTNSTAPGPIVERVFVETGVDTDRDGWLDLVAVWVKRPADAGDRVPAVLVANPYMLHCNEDWYDLYDVDRNLVAVPGQDIAEEDVRYDFSVSPEVTPEHVRPAAPAGPAERVEWNPDDFECISVLYDHLLARGYAGVFCGGLGTRYSDGVVLTGSREEAYAFRAVVEWLHGDRRAFADRSCTTEVRADWCTGKVAMSAKSYLGTMQMAVATTGVPGLRTIIPEAGISNFYEYYKRGGLNLPALGWQGDDLATLAKYCTSRTFDPDDFASIRDVYEASQAELLAGQDRETANYSRFWDERNYLRVVDQMRCSALIIQGLNDWNVKPDQAVWLYEAMRRRGLEAKLFLHRGQHVYTYGLRGSGTVELIDRWLDHYLRGVDNGVDRELGVTIESDIDQRVWETYPDWTSRNSTFVLPIVSVAGETTAEGSLAGEAAFTDDLASTCWVREQGNEPANDAAWLDELVLSDHPCALRYRYRLPKDLHFSGIAHVAFDAAIDQPTTILSAMLVDVGERCRLTADPDGDAAALTDSYEFNVEETPSPYRVITRGWLNAQNRICDWRKEDVEPGEYYHYELDLVAADATLPAGVDLGLVLYGIDVQETQRPFVATRVTVRQDTIRCEIPVIS